MEDKTTLNGTEINIGEILSEYQSEVEAVRKIHEITGASFPEVMDVVKKFKKESAEDDRSSSSEDSNCTNDLSEFEKLFDEMINCPRCGAEIPNKSKFCLECGADLTKPQAIRCPNCNRIIPSKSKFCLYCGFNLLEKPIEYICENCGMPIKPGESVCSYCRQPTGMMVFETINRRAEAPTKDAITNVKNGEDTNNRKQLICSSCHGNNLRISIEQFRNPDGTLVNKKKVVCQDCGYSWFI